MAPLFRSDCRSLKVTVSISLGLLAGRHPSNEKTTVCFCLQSWGNDADDSVDVETVVSHHLLCYIPTIAYHNCLPSRDRIIILKIDNLNRKVVLRLIRRHDT
jgi:hypothetical protein